MLCKKYEIEITGCSHKELFSFPNGDCSECLKLGKNVGQSSHFEQEVSQEHTGAYLNDVGTHKKQPTHTTEEVLQYAE